MKCPNCGLKGEAAKLPHSCKQPDPADFRKRVQALQKEFDYIHEVTMTGMAELAAEACSIIDRKNAGIEELKKKYEDLSNTVQISCNPSNDCNDPKVLKKYMKTCFEQTLEDLRVREFPI